jgi:cobalt-zinc-cadmium efflux system outer membrane protein
MIGKYGLALLLLTGVMPSWALAQPQAPTTPRLASRQLTLAQAEELLRLRSLAVAANRQQLEASRAGRLIAGFKPNPVLTLGAQQLPVTSNVPGSVPRFVSTNPDAGANPVLTAHVDKIIERGSKREFRVAQAEAVVDATLAQIEDTLRTQRFQLRQAFVAALLARDNLQLAAQLQDQYAQTVTLTASRVTAGNIAPVDLYRIQAASLPFQQTVLDAQNSYQQAARDVLNLLDVAPDDIPAPTSDGPQPTAEARPVAGVTPSQAAPPGMLLATDPIQIEGSFSNKRLTLSLNELRTQALANRPDVQMARSTLRAAAANGRLAEAQRSRDVVVGAEYQRVGNDQAVGVTTQIPLFAYNNQRAGVTQAVALERAAEAQLRQAERQAFTDVDKAYQGYLTASRALALYNDANLKQVADVRSVTAYTYERGAVSLLELLDAERLTRQTLAAYNQARAAYQLALFQLEQATGVPLP